MSKKSNITIDIRPHSRYPETHWNVVVTTSRGYCYRCSWAGDKPTEEQVRQAWKEDRRSFDPDPTGGAGG